jgi:hypothetical protein
LDDRLERKFAVIFLVSFSVLFIFTLTLAYNLALLCEGGKNEENQIIVCCVVFGACVIALRVLWRKDGANVRV